MSSSKKRPHKSSSSSSKKQRAGADEEARLIDALSEKKPTRKEIESAVAGGPACTGERDVIDVMSRSLGHRTFLAPTGHAAVDELSVSSETNVRA